MKRQIRLRLTLDVTYNARQGSEKDYADGLLAQLQSAIARGMLTDDLDATVARWEADVHVRREIRLTGKRFIASTGRRG